MNWTHIIIVALAGALGAALANRGIAIFHDAFRPIMPELLSGRMQRREFASLTFGSSFGLIVFFGIPFSLVSGIVLGHAIWLGTDVIGTWFPGPSDRAKNPARSSYWGLFGSMICGAVYGGLLTVAIRGLNDIVGRLPVDFFGYLKSLSDPVIFTLAVIPALAIAYQYGTRHGVIAFGIILLVRQVTGAFLSLSPDAIAFLAGMLVLAFHAIREVRCELPTEDLFIVSDENVTRVRRYLPWIALLGAVYALSSNMGVLMEGPQSLLVLAQGDRLNAINYVFARALSFLPMRTMSILSTGVFTIEGLGLAPAIGLLSPTPVIAAIAGALIMSLEALSLVNIAKFFNRFPCILKAANNLRTAMTKLLDVASLVGGMIAANAMAPGFGFFAVAGLYVFNEAAGAPVARTAIGPISVILVGLVLNLLTVLN